MSSAVCAGLPWGPEPALLEHVGSQDARGLRLRLLGQLRLETLVFFLGEDTPVSPKTCSSQR